MTDMSHPDSPSPDVAFGATAAQPIPRKRVISWAMWDWAMQPFNTVILTFVWVALRDASRKLDKAVSKGVIHKNQAANKKSAMAKAVSKLG